jgi:hypothetical protein
MTVRWNHGQEAERALSAYHQSDAEKQKPPCEEKGVEG